MRLLIKVLSIVCNDHDKIICWKPRWCVRYLTTTCGFQSFLEENMCCSSIDCMVYRWIQYISRIYIFMRASAAIGNQMMIPNKCTLNRFSLSCDHSFLFVLCLTMGVPYQFWIIHFMIHEMCYCAVVEFTRCYFHNWAGLVQKALNKCGT